MTNLVVGTAGHIDHGKSTLVRALTGIDPDRLKEEKARGITIELGFAHTTIGDTRVAFVDVPGHERFVRTMLAGVGGIDCVLLIVAADESVMPQTREHFDICRLLQISRGIVVLTKADAADAETRAMVRQDVAELVKGSFLESAEVVEVSATTGEGLDVLRDAIAAQAVETRLRPVSGAARLPIDRAFTMKGFGTVITGTLVSGRIALDDELAIVPSGRRVKIRGIQVHGTAAAFAAAGRRTAINLGGIEVGQIEPRARQDRGEQVPEAGQLELVELGAGERSGWRRGSRHDARLWHAEAGDSLRGSILQRCLERRRGHLRRKHGACPRQRLGRQGLGHGESPGSRESLRRGQRLRQRHLRRRRCWNGLWHHHLRRDGGRGRRGEAARVRPGLLGAGHHLFIEAPEVFQ